MPEHLISKTEAEGDLLACAAYLAEEVGGSDDRSTAMSAVVAEYLKRDNVDLAAELANTVDDPFVRDRLLVAVVRRCAELGDDEYAIQLADAVEEDGMRSQAFAAAALVKARQGDLEKARELAASVLHPEDVLAVIALKQDSSGDEAAAQATIAEIDYAGSAVAALIAMAAARKDKDDAGKAVEFLEKAGQLAEEIEHREERVRMLVDVGNALTDAGRKDKAIGTLEKARGHAEALDNVHRDTLLSFVSQGFMHAGSIDLADRTLDAVADKTQIANTLLGFSRDYWRREEKEDALEALDEAYEILRSQKDTETRDSKAKFALFGNIATQYAAFGKGERAIEIAEGIEDDEQSTSALSQVAYIMTTQNADDTAQASLRSIPAETDRVFALIAISNAARKNNENEKALSFLNEAAETAEGVQQIAARANAYSEIAVSLLELDEKEKARETASLTLQEIAQMRDEGMRSVALANLAGLYQKAGFTLSDKDNELLKALLIPDSF
ncbi:MAG: hypothetical protein KF685_10750 [Acidobacteria bacterium]|nr:hypothetical protein [Acidobacteriota bacterium]